MPLWHCLPTVQGCLYADERLVLVSAEPFFPCRGVQESFDILDAVAGRLTAGGGLVPLVRPGQQELHCEGGRMRQNLGRRWCRVHLLIHL